MQPASAIGWSLRLTRRDSGYLIALLLGLAGRPRRPTGLVRFLTRARGQGPGRRRRRPGAVRAVVAVVPRRGRRPRRDLRVGAGGAGPRGRRAGRAIEEIAGPGAPIGGRRRHARGRPVPHAARARRRCGSGCRHRRRGDRALDGVHFDIPEPMRRIECMIAPTENGGIYYTGPSDDFSRPGPDVVVGAAGRRRVQHLAREDHRLPRGRPRPSPADRPAVLNRAAAQHVAPAGLLDLRPRRGLGAVRRAADGGVRLHGRPRATSSACWTASGCGPPAWCSTSASIWASRRPSEWGGGTWDADKAWELLQGQRQHGRGVPPLRANRYLGWPGQAPSYKIGQRLWEQTGRRRGRRRGERSP